MAGNSAKPFVRSRQGQLSLGSPNSVVQNHTRCGNSDTATKGYSRTQPLPQKKLYFHQTILGSHGTLCPAGAWSGCLLMRGALSQTVWGWTFHNILSFMLQMPLDTTKGYEWKEKARTIKSSWGRDSVSISPCFQNGDRGQEGRKSPKV